MEVKFKKMYSMKKILIFNVLFALMFSLVSFAQEEQVEEEEPMTPMTDIFEKAIVEEKKPVEYAAIREEDVLWSQSIWRIIDCREKLNFHLYYPTDDIQSRKSLAQALVDGIRNKKIQAYDDENFAKKLSISKVTERLGAADKEVRQDKIDGPGDTLIIQKGYVSWGQIREYKVKEKWFFDKRHSRLDVRIIAICPVKVFKKDNDGNSVDATGSDMDNLARQELCWIYFPEARRVLANTTCYTGKNQQANISFDDVFHKRYFSSRITRATNVNDIDITEYTHGGIEAILESERIKNEMLKMESDFWNY
ncbi:MAG: gliding motility protein GldN [Prevotellaceae bacterium]|nr:gliding motility protein GldN [Prevotellaceae bacterium]